MSPAFARIDRCADMVFCGTPIRRANSPAGTPSGSRVTRSRNVCRRVACDRAARAERADTSFIYPDYRMNMSGARQYGSCHLIVDDDPRSGMAAFSRGLKRVASLESDRLGSIWVQAPMTAIRRTGLFAVAMSTGAKGRSLATIYGARGTDRIGKVQLTGGGRQIGETGRHMLHCNIFFDKLCSAA